MNTQSKIASPHQVSPEEILALLGLGELSIAITNQMDVASLLERGLPKKCIGSLVNGTGMTLNEMSFTMNVTDRTLKRWLAHAGSNQLLAPLESSQLWLMAVTFKHAGYVMGNEQLALTWLRSNPIGLNGRRPLDLLRTPLGVDVLINLLAQIDGCVYI